MSKPYAVVFAGVPGVSKTPIAHYLSCEFSLPIFSTDQIRYEVREDLRLDDINKPGGVTEFEKRAEARLKTILSAHKPFVFDGSVDRSWADRKSKFQAAGYAWFMVNIEPSRPFLEQLYNETGRSDWAHEHLEAYLRQHQAFKTQFSRDISVTIDDHNFSQRLQSAADALRDFLKNR